jgi:crotonobetainyl-CoA:carnitine CoA-transferase CaiB-like acyl-CoA transferase
MMALYARERTGLGQLVDVSLFHIGLYQLSYDVAGALVTGQDYDDWVLKPPQELLDEAEAVNRRLLDFYMANMGSPLSVPLPYETRDGKRLLLAMVQSDLYWSKFCSVIEREELEKDPRFETTEMRSEYGGMLYHILKDIFLSRTLEEWKTRLKGIPYGCYQNLRDIVSDPVAQKNGYFIDYEHPAHGRIEGLASPVRLSDMPAVVRRTAPEFGQHTEEVLLENGYTWEDITRFKEQGIIA